MIKKYHFVKYTLFNKSNSFLHIIFMVQDESIHVEIELHFFYAFIMNKNSISLMPCHEQSFGNLWWVWLLLFFILTLVSLDI